MMDMIENEKKKEFLNSYLLAKQDVRRLEEQLEELRDSKISISVTYDGMPKGTGFSDLSEYAAKIDELEREIKDKRYERIQTFLKVQRAIEGMGDSQEKTLLTYKYLRGYGWERIATDMGYTYRHITRLHGVALRNFKMSYHVPLEV